MAIISRLPLNSVSISDGVLGIRARAIEDPEPSPIYSATSKATEEDAVASADKEDDTQRMIEEVKCQDAVAEEHRTIRNHLITIAPHPIFEASQQI